jgi:hypothetical protein
MQTPLDDVEWQCDAIGAFTEHRAAQQRNEQHTHQKIAKRTAVAVPPSSSHDALLKRQYLPAA